MSLAVEHVVARGHSRLVHFAGPRYSMHAEERINGTRRACSASHIVLTDEQIARAGAHLEGGYRAGLSYFRDRAPAERPTAATCYNDLVAIGLCRARDARRLVTFRGLRDVGKKSSCTTPARSSVRLLVTASFEDTCL